MPRRSVGRHVAQPDVGGRAGNDRVLARRFDFHRRPLDPEPLVLDVSNYSPNQRQHTPPSIAFDGSTYTVTWTRRPSMTFALSYFYTIRIDEEGPPFEALDTLVGSGYDIYGPGAVRTLWTGNHYLVSWPRGSSTEAP